MLTFIYCFCQPILGQDNLGIYHPDDMSGIILDSYHRYLTGKEIKLEEQIKFYQDYWKKANEQNKKK